MSSDNIQRQIEFILEHQAKFSEDLELLKEVQSRQAANIDNQAANIDNLAANIDNLAANIDKLTEVTTSIQGQVGSVISEMRDGFNHLILANEITRDFANKIASLEVQTSQRMTKLEQRVSDIESKQ